jgi:hypothetical protein
MLPEWSLSLREACSTFSGKGPQPLLWAGLGAARVKITISKNNEVKVKFTLEETLKTQRGSRGIALLFL